jgi:hypothetical protein
VRNLEHCLYPFIAWLTSDILKGELEVMQLTETSEPTCWRLIRVSEPASESAPEEFEEVVVSVTGAILDKKLPPISDQLVLSVIHLEQLTYVHCRRRAEYFKQEITLTGLGSPSFQRAVDATETVYTFIERGFEDGQLVPYDFVKDRKGFGPTMEVANRFFTPRKDAPNMVAVKCGKEVDPRGIVEAVCREKSLVHGEDNKVEFFASTGAGNHGKRRCGINGCKCRARATDGFHSFKIVEPKIFRTGDLVEVRFSFVVVPLSGGKRMMKAILRSVALVDDSFAKVSIGVL